MKLIGIPRPQRFDAPWEFVESMLQVKGWEIISKCGAWIDQNRNSLWTVARGTHAEKLLMIDTDIVFKMSDIEKLDNDNLDIVGGMYRMGYGRNKWCLFKDAELEVKDPDYDPILEPTDGIMEVGGMGAGFLMVNREVLEKMQDPFTFRLVNGFFQGEDLSFCYRARKMGFKVCCDTDVKVGHIRTQIL
jgi:hypothetical protein